ncbi:sorting nexin-21-like [Stegodyphus dumicola]|uniref:sorting nexin-21-like n=1 Tax=Stegodyphus dumicola TaxID=202533 RepID=UPI0015A9F78D|nr:sorting nexin-21-like [Stegodyphus dumicola]
MFGRLLTNEEEEKTSSLDDDFDDSGLTEIVGGKLTFNDGENAGSSTEKFRSWSGISGSSVGSELSPRRASQRVTFEIVSAKTVTDAKKKYVSYTILVKRAPGLETQPGVLERRYSDFLSLFQTLKKRYPSLLGDFPFPKKAILGNFTADVITERSVAFQHFLAFSYSVRELRQSLELADFLYTREIQEAHSMMKLGQFEDSSVLLENIYFVQEKILDEGHFSTYYTLCVLVACLNAVDNVAEAQKYAEIALTFAAKHERNELTVPLLVLAVRLWWAVGKDKKGLEKRLYELKQSGINTDKQPTLLELVLHRECPLKMQECPLKK